MKPRGRRSWETPPSAGEAEQLLSPRRAFVVQFREEMDATPGRCGGRVEHIVSGHATRFSSREELWMFFSRILSSVHD